MLSSLSRYPNIWLLAGFLFCFGSTMGSRGPLVAAAAMSIFRGKRVGTIMGTISIGAGLGAAIGSWAGGLIHDWTQSYDLVFVFAMGTYNNLHLMAAAPHQGEEGLSEHTPTHAAGITPVLPAAAAPKKGS